MPKPILDAQLTKQQKNSVSLIRRHNASDICRHLTTTNEKLTARKFTIYLIFVKVLSSYYIFVPGKQLNFPGIILFQENV